MNPTKIIFILPGFLGTHLKTQTGIRVWFSPFMLFKGMKKLSLNNDNIQTEKVVDFIYGDLEQTLSKNKQYQVHTFPIDWRKSLRAQGEDFAKFAEEKVNNRESSVSIIAHSQGGLLAQSAIADSPFLKDRLENSPDSKFIMLGTPVNGTYIVPHFLLGKDWFETPSIFDGTLWENSVREILSKFGGLLDMMPTDPDIDLYSSATWKNLYDVCNINALPPQQEDLEASKKFRNWLQKNPINNEYSYYIRGKSDSTPSGLKIKNIESEETVYFEHTNYGDAVSDWETSEKITNTFLAHKVHHAFLPRNEEVISAISNIIESISPTSVQNISGRGVSYDETRSLTTKRSVIPPFPV